MKDNLQEKAQNAIDALKVLKQSVFDKCGVDGVDNKNGEFYLNWHPEMTAEDLLRQSVEIAEETLAKSKAVQPGRIYCYYCESAGCEHSVCSDPGRVFKGYSSTGKPQWQEFFQMMLELGDRRTEELFHDPPKLLARIINEKKLASEQLVSFGRNSLTYRIWGEVIAGYLIHDKNKKALTLQVVETKDRNLHLNIIVDQRLLETIIESKPKGKSPFYRIHDALEKVRSKISFLSLAWQQEHKKMKKKEMERKVFKHLTDFAHSIERKGRQKQRRTSHAETRAKEKRPVHKAREDLQNAATASFFKDRFKNTIIVIGRSARAHVFNGDGHHITSLTLNREELERRQLRKRYVVMPSEEVAGFRQTALSINDVDEK